MSELDLSDEQTQKLLSLMREVARIIEADEMLLDDQQLDITDLKKAFDEFEDSYIRVDMTGYKPPLPN